MAINCFSIAATEEAVSSINSDIMGVLGIVTVNIVPEKFYFPVKIDYASNNACRHIHSKCMRTKFDAREYLNRTRAQQKYQRNFIGCARTHESAANMLKQFYWLCQNARERRKYVKAN